MARKTQQIDEQYVKKETLYLVSLLALAVGFFGGVIFGVYKSDSPLPGRSSSPAQSSTTQSSDSGLSNMIAALEKEVASNPNNVTAWIELGNNYFDANQYDNAIRAYQRSLEIQPNNANVLTDMGVMYRRSGKPQEAIKAFDKAMEVDPKHEVSRFNKGVVLLHDLNDIQGAIQAWEDLMKVNPFALTPSGQSVDQMVTQMRKQLKQQSATQ
ncbi:MAG: tetratricopeptide repeat protein [Desulfobacterales bacterium]|jgi:cytochrome c-type biogenesis protein CcmH/NrfG